MAAIAYPQNNQWAVLTDTHNTQHTLTALPGTCVPPQVDLPAPPLPTHTSVTSTSKD